MEGVGKKKLPINSKPRKNELLSNVFGLPGFFPPQLRPLSSVLNSHHPGGTTTSTSPSSSIKTVTSDGPNNNKLSLVDFLNQFPMHQSFVFDNSESDIFPGFLPATQEIEVIQMAPSDSRGPSFLGPRIISSSSRSTVTSKKNPSTSTTSGLISSPNNSTNTTTTKKQQKKLSPDPMLRSMLDLLLQSSDDLFHNLHKATISSGKNFGPGSTRTDPCAKDVQALCPPSKKKRSKLHCLGLENREKISAPCFQSIKSALPYACAYEIHKFNCFEDDDDDDEIVSTQPEPFNSKDDEPEKKKTLGKSKKIKKNPIGCLEENVKDISSPLCLPALRAVSKTVDQFRRGGDVALVSTQSGKVHSVYPSLNSSSENNLENNENRELKWLMQLEIGFLLCGVVLLLCVFSRILYGPRWNVALGTIMGRLSSSSSSFFNKQDVSSNNLKYGAVMM